MPARYTTVIEDDVMTVLKASAITGTELRLPPTQLDRKLYVRVNQVLEAAGGKWNRAKKAHIFPGDPKEPLGMVINAGVVVDEKKLHQQFFTPEDLALELVQRAWVKPGMDVLEPSAGAGAIAVALRGHGTRVTCVEQDPALVELLRQQLFTVIQTDFLTLTSFDLDKVECPRQFDRVVMNPPFTKGQDIKHIEYALSFLKPGGLLVGVMGAGIKTNSTKTATAFRKMVDAHQGFFEDLPEESFKESGTLVNTVMVVIPT
jgi:predicted RNA methylase